MSTYTYIREESDRAEFRNFCQHHIKAFARPPKDEIWHYTSAEGLIGILQSGKIWTTQITCLNDNLEQRYFSDLVHASLKEILKTNSDPNLAVAYRVIDEALSKADFSGEGRFVACFSEVEDDLGQWRGYGGGECGYAIGFRFDGLLEVLKGRPNALLVPMNYDGKTQKILVDDVLRMFQVYFLQGIQQRGVTDVEQWTRELSSTFAFELDIFASLIKHPKFSGENERRITLRLLEEDRKQLEFRQKRTLLARHLPLNLAVKAPENKLLPITRIYVGPSPSQSVSRVSVYDILNKFGYENIPVELSTVPYRVP